MTPDETRLFLTWANQHDPRIEASPVNAEVWGAALGPFSGLECKTATVDYYRRNSDKLTPAVLANACRSARTTAEARATSRALPPAPDRYGRITLAEWRAAHPGRWEELFEQGRAEQEQLKAEQAAKVAVPAAADPFAEFGRGFAA